MRRFYFGKNGKVDKQSFKQYNNLLSDNIFYYPIFKTVDYQSQLSSGKTFVYKWEKY